MKNLIRREQFPYTSALGWEYDSGDYHVALQKAMDAVGYAKLRADRKPSRRRSSAAKPGNLWASALRSSPRSRGGTVAQLRHPRYRDVRFRRDPHHPTGSVIARLGTKSQGQGHETTYAQIIATELGLVADNITVEEGNTDTAPYGLGTYGSRSTPVSSAAAAVAARKIKPRPR